METKLRFISFIIKRKQRISPLDCRLPSAGWVLVLLRHLRNSNELLDLSAANTIFHSVFLFKCLKRKKNKQNCARTFHIHVLKDELHMSQPGGHPGVLLQRASSSFDILQDSLHFPYNTETKKYISDVWLVSCDKVTQEFCHSSLTTNKIPNTQR